MYLSFEDLLRELNAFFWVAPTGLVDYTPSEPYHVLLFGIWEQLFALLEVMCELLKSSSF